jgi:NAD(P)-dependent dehydrogenase (short-subunit alcohol dehydrogenase family)
MKIDGIGAVVTGGASGLGEATARMLAARGAKVGVLDLNREAAERLAQEIRGVALVADAADEKGASEAFDTATQRMGPVRILVNCAGVGSAGRIVGRNGPMPLADFERVVRINLIGTFNMMRLFAVRLFKEDALDDDARGVIVNTASIAAFDGQVGQTAYAASKGAIVSLTLPAAREFARMGIRINTIAPGLFRTPLLYTLSEEARNGLAACFQYPQRFGDPADFAAAVCFLIENQHMNGETLRLDGAVRLQPR